MIRTYESTYMLKVDNINMDLFTDKSDFMLSKLSEIVGRKKEEFTVDNGGIIYFVKAKQFLLVKGDSKIKIITYGDYSIQKNFEIIKIFVDSDNIDKVIYGINEEVRNVKIDCLNKLLNESLKSVGLDLLCRHVSFFENYKKNIFEIEIKILVENDNEIICDIDVNFTPEKNEIKDYFKIIKEYLSNKENNSLLFKTLLGDDNE